MSKVLLGKLFQRNNKINSKCSRCNITGEITDKTCNYDKHKTCDKCRGSGSVTQ